VLLIVMETIPPPFHVEESAKDVPALHVPEDPLEGVGVTPPLEELELEGELDELEEEDDEDELDEEEALEEALEADPALQLP
jgi:hypothetical protein